MFSRSAKLSGRGGDAMTEPFVDPKTEALPLVTAPPATYRLDLLRRKVQEGGFPELAERLDKESPVKVMWEVADECLNVLLQDVEVAASMYAARVRLELKRLEREGDA